MRILIVSNLYPPNVIGGYERLCFEVTAGLAAQGHEMTVLTSRFGGRLADYPQQRILRELDLLTGADIYTPFPGGPDDRARINQSNLRILARVLEEVQPNVVFAWNLFFLDASVLTALEESRFRTVVMLTDNWLLVMRNGPFVADFFRDYVHGPRVFVPPPEPEPDVPPPPAARGFLQRLKAAILGRPKPAPVPVSPPAPPRTPEAIFGAAFMRDLYAAGGSRFRRHRVIHNGVKQTAYAGTEARDRARFVRPGTLRLLFAGRLVDLKGAHTAVAAMALLDPAASGVACIELTILGDAQDKAYMEVLDAAIRDSPRAADIILRPAVPEDALFALFDDHDIYLFPSLYEPFSLTLIHALACGIPTIASATGGNPEIIRDGESGLLFRKGDPADLARAVTRLATDPGLRIRLARTGQATARGFTFERMVGEMAAFLERPA
jgi:glycosyltransferase involved in cell wall biosynthesis